MCFSEFIGYTCGHSSLAVLRPCPLTTERHSNPICSVYAQRPFLAQEMCSVCQRLMHSRAILIEEAEHRFMHERGVCGCDVVFPSLIRPRVLGPAADSLFPSDDKPCSEQFSYEDESMLRSTAVNTTEIPPIYQEIQRGDQRQVLVRLPSLFGAEWLTDHQKEHVTGHCDCQVDFKAYSGADPSEQVPLNDPGGCRAGEHRGSREDSYGARSTIRVKTLEQVASRPRLPIPPRPDYPEDNGSGSHARGRSLCDIHTGRLSQSAESSARTTPGPSSEPNRQGQGRLSAPESKSASLGSPLSDSMESGHLVPARVAGAVYHVPPPLIGAVGPYLSVGQSSLDDTTERPSLTVDAQTCVYPMQGLPLAGLPIGAGPEGQVTHMSPWENCPLNGYQARTA